MKKFYRCVFMLLISYIMLMPCAVVGADDITLRIENVNVTTQAGDFVIKVTLNVENTDNGMLVVAAYNDNKLLKTVFQDIGIGKVLTVNVPEKSEYTIKTFLWKDIESMQPLAQSDKTTVYVHLVNTAEDLLHVGNPTSDGSKYDSWTLGSYYIQTSDIDMNGEEFTAIGDFDEPFTGSYDGGGFTITSLTINGGSSNYQGFFGYIGTDGIVENVGLVGGMVSSTADNVGFVAGVNNGTVQNCYATGCVSGASNVGDVVGLNNGMVQNCYVTGCVIGTSNVGGVVGLNNGTVQNCIGLNPCVTATGSPDIGLVAGRNGGTLANNYAWSGMTVTGSGYSASIGDNQKDGKDLSATTAQTKAAWEAAGFLFADSDPTACSWIWTEGKMPSLSTDSSQNWPVYLVDAPTSEDPVQPTIPNGYTAIDLSSYTLSGATADKATYNNQTGILTVTGPVNTLNFPLDDVLNEGEQVHLIVRGSHSGSSSFRCMLANGTTAVSEKPITNGVTGDGLWQKPYGFLWQHTMTVLPSSTASSIAFKGPNDSTDLDNLTIYSILIKYGGDPAPSPHKVQPVVNTKPTAQEIEYGEPLSSAALSGGVVKYGNVTVEGTFSWYSPTTIPAGGTNPYTVKFTPSEAFASLYNTAICQLNVTPKNYSASSNEILVQNFDGGTMGAFTGRGGATAEIAGGGYFGNCLKGTGRTSANNGLQLDITSLIQPGNTYSISAYVKTAAGSALNMSIVKTMGTDGYDGINTKTPNNGWVELSGSYTVPYGCTKFILFFQTDEAGKTNDIFIDDVEITLTNKPAGEVIVGSLKSAYSPVFGKVGGAVTYEQMKNEVYISFIKSQFNSVTLANEMKPDALLGSSPATAATLPTGYVANEKYAYKDSSYFKMDFTKIDECIDMAYKSGIKIRFNVLLWHAQTPRWFFAENFSTSTSTQVVDADTMNGRLEYYIRNVMNHVYSTAHGKDVVDCWDVANEYTHNYDGGQKSCWDQVYYPSYTYSSTQHSGIWDPSYVIDAFTFADNQLLKLESQGKIPNSDAIDLFYNDYNEYLVTDDIIKLINNINKDKIVCDGVGMQMHININFPNPSATGQIATAIDKFNKAGFKIQLTEIDVTNYDGGAVNDSAQIQYYDTLFKMLVAKKSSGANITGITFGGLDDATSWRASGKPLLFDSLYTAKPMFCNVLAAANLYIGGPPVRPPVLCPSHLT